MANLFPVFEVPETKLNTTAEEQKYKKSAYFDFEKGDFVRNGTNNIVEASGREAYKQWCEKVVMTERLTKLAYSHRIGIETDELWSLTDKKAIESAIEATITDALMVNNKTDYVRDFEFNWDSNNSISVIFTVKGKEWEEFSLQTNKLIQ